MSELNYGDNVEHLLYELSQYYEGEVKGSFEIRGETEDGIEGYEYIEVSLIADDAVNLIAELKAQRDALQEKVDFKQNLTEQIVELKKQRDALAAENANLRHLLDMVGETGNANFGRTKLPTPATDAYLNSVRAEGADAAGQKLRRAIPLFKSIHAGAVGECADIAEMIAAQLRAGEPSQPG